jgi:hypothetical protein
MMRRVLPLIGLVVVTNLVMLASARANRTGEPDALVRLTERELRVQRSTERDSAPQLWLFAGRADDDSWLDGARLAALGVDCSLPASDESAPLFYARQLPRTIFGVYEFDGPAWQREVQRFEARRRVAENDPTESVRTVTIANIDRELQGSTRLLAVDAGLDAASLRRAHPDRQRYLVLPSSLRVTARAFDADGRKIAMVLRGSISPTTTELIASRDLRRAAERLAGTDPAGRWADVPPHYYATIAVGRRHEPWIVSVEPIDTLSPPH